MTERKGFRIRETAHYIAHHEAHRIATSNARKVSKAIRYLEGINEKLVRDAAYRSTYDAIYPAKFQEEIIDLILQNATEAADRTTNDVGALAAHADLRALLSIRKSDHERTGPHDGSHHHVGHAPRSLRARRRGCPGWPPAHVR